MPAPIALQLYTVREAMANDFEGVVRKVAKMGYVGVEPAGFPGTTPEAAGQLFRKLGLAVPSAHLAMPVGEHQQYVLDAMHAIGSTRIVSGLGPDQFKTEDQIKSACDRFNEASAVAVEHGMTFGIHNHWWEFLRVGDRYAYTIMLEHLAPEVFFEVDTYWVQTAGADPSAVVGELGTRAPLLHIKDGPCDKDKPMTAVGDGIVDFHRIVAAGGANTEWMIVELDRCATDMLEAVRKSCTYLIGSGLARGNAPH